MTNIESVNFETNGLDNCSINFEQHIQNALGAPLELPDCLQSILADNWASEAEDDLLALFRLMTGCNYQQVWRDNTYNSENDLDSFAVITVYADDNCPDWCWRRDVFVVVEIGSGGDPRYCSYSEAKVYRLEDETIGDSGFLDWKLGYWLQPISTRQDESELDSLNDRLSSCYSSYPWGELTDSLYAEPIWSERRKAYVCRPKDSRFAVTVFPVGPYY
jgi:hypothetical protein